MGTVITTVQSYVLKEKELQRGKYRILETQLKTEIKKEENS